MVVLRVLVALTIACALAVPPAVAGTILGSGRLSAFAGAHFPTDDVEVSRGADAQEGSEDLDTSFVVGARAEYFLPGLFGPQKYLGGAAEIFYFQTDASPTLSGGADDRLEVDVYGGSLNLMLRLPVPFVEPYAGAGVVGAVSRAELREAAAGGRESTKEEEFDVGGQVLVGLRYAFGPADLFFIGAEGRYLLLEQDFTGLSSRSKFDTDLSGFMGLITFGIQF